MFKKIIQVFAITGLISCAPSPEPIDYGNDACHYCKMTIVDKQHAAEVVTAKGKVYKFDAIECMIQFTGQNENNYAFLLVNDFRSPGRLIAAETSSFLVSRAIPSPMGAYLSAFEHEQTARQIQNEKGGTIYDWEEIQSNLTDISAH